MGMTYTYATNQPAPVFSVDGERSDDQYLFVKVREKGLVVITNEEEGLSVGIFPLDAEGGDPVIAQTSATNDELIKEEEE